MNELCNIVPDKGFVLAAIIASLPGAWLAFKRYFIRELQDQMIDLQNPTGIGVATVKFPYNVIARIMIGPPNTWLNLFDPTAKDKLWKKDKTSTVRIALWFLLAFLFSLIAWYCAAAATVYFPEESGGGTKPSLSAQSDVLGKHNAQADALMERGLTLQKEEKIDAAIETYEKVIRKYPAEVYDDGMSMGGRLYSDDAREHLAVLFCRKQRGSDFSSDSPEKLAKAIRDAFLAQKTDLLVSYASCAFKVGLAAPSDYVWSQPPSQVMPVIIKLGPALNWDAARFDNFGELVIKTPKGEAHVFIFEEAKDRWKWVGYFTSDDKILDRLSKANRPKK